jgi:hypothetical protein
MAIGVNYKTLVNARPSGSEMVVSDFFDIPGPPAPGTLSYRILELPLKVVTPPSATDYIVVRQVDPTTHIFNPMIHQVFTMVTYPAAPGAGEFQIKNPDTFVLSTILFNTLDGGKTVEIIDTGRGSLVYAEDVNDPRDEIKDSRDTEIDLGIRLDKIEDGTRLHAQGMVWHSYPVSYADVSTGSLINSITLFSLPAGSIVHGVVIYHTTEFLGGNITNTTLSLGISGDLVKYASPWDVFQAPATNLALVSQDFFLEDVANPVNVLLTATSDVNLSDLTQGAATIKVLISKAF